MAWYYVRRIILGEEKCDEGYGGMGVDRTEEVCYGKRDGDHRG